MAKRGLLKNSRQATREAAEKARAGVRYKGQLYTDAKLLAADALKSTKPEAIAKAQWAIDNAAMFNGDAGQLFRGYESVKKLDAAEAARVEGEARAKAASRGKRRRIFSAAREQEAAREVSGAAKSGLANSSGVQSITKKVARFLGKPEAGYAKLGEAVNEYLDAVYEPSVAAKLKPQFATRLDALGKVLETAKGKLGAGAASQEVFELAVQGTATELGGGPQGLQGYIKAGKDILSGKPVGKSIEAAHLTSTGRRRLSALGKSSLKGSKAAVTEALETTLPETKGLLSSPLRTVRSALKTEGSLLGSAAKIGGTIALAGLVGKAADAAIGVPKIRRELAAEIQTPEQILQALKAQELMMLHEARTQGELQAAAGGQLQSFQSGRTLVPGAAYYSGAAGGGGPSDADLAALLGG